MMTMSMCAAQPSLTNLAPSHLLEICSIRLLMGLQSAVLTHSVAIFPFTFFAMSHAAVFTGWTHVAWTLGWFQPHGS